MVRGGEAGLKGVGGGTGDSVSGQDVTGWDGQGELEG